MLKSFTKSAFFLFCLIIGGLSAASILYPFQQKDGFSNYNMPFTTGVFPDSQKKVLLQDTYPTKNKNQISNNNSSDVWKYYPTFQLGSYKQITNNITHPNNPDIGTCSPSSFCGAIYHDKPNDNEYKEILPMPPVDNNIGTRVGYFTTNERVITSLPYRSETQNILY